MKISPVNFFYDLEAPQISKYSKTDIGGNIPVERALKAGGKSWEIVRVQKNPEDYSSLFIKQNAA